MIFAKNDTTFADHMLLAEEQALAAIREQFAAAREKTDPRGHAMLAAIEQHYLACISDAFGLVTKAIAPDTAPRLKIAKEESA